MSPEAHQERGSSRTTPRARAIVVGLGLVGLLAASGYFFFSFTRRTDYLNSINFRLLTSIGSQIEAWVKSQRTVFQSRLDSEKLRGTVQARLVSDSDGPLTLELTFSPKSKTLETSSPPKPEALAPKSNKPVPFDRDLLAPLGTNVQKDVFDLVFLATPDGTILAREGESELYLADLSSVVKTVVKTRQFREESKQTETVDLEIAGTAYKLFIQPCCQSLSVAAPADTPPGLVVCGLVPNATLLQRRLAISSSALVIAAGFLLLTAVSFPFVKFTLIGPQQHVTLLDVLLLGISSLLLVSIGTLCCLDFLAYKNLTGDEDESLAHLSDQIWSSARSEIAAAHAQLLVLRDAALRDGSDPGTFVDAFDRRPGVDFSYYPFFESFAMIDRDGMQKAKWTVMHDPTPLVSVKHREYFLQVTHNRMWSLPAAPSTLGEDLPAIRQFALESIRSKTRGVNQAALAVPVPSNSNFEVAALSIPMISLIRPVLPPGFGFAVIEDKDNGRVLFHSEQQRNLIEDFFLQANRDRRLRSVVAARHEESFDLQYWGKNYRAHATPLTGFPWTLITFSDKELTWGVNVDWIFTTLFFLASYMTLYLVACVAILLRPAKRTTWLWPRPGAEKAYLWLAVAFAVVIVASGLALRVASPAVLLRLAFTVPLLAWLLAYVRLGPIERAIRARPPIVAPSACEPTELLSWSYVGAGALLFVATAIVPTIAFFKVAHAVQVVPFVKYTQLKLAMALEERRQRVESDVIDKWCNSSAVDPIPGAQGDAGVLVRRTAINDRQLEFCRMTITAATSACSLKGEILPVDTYLPSFGTSVIRSRYSAPKNDGARATDSLPTALEPLLPYYSDFSVVMRELLHDQSSDQARTWYRQDNLITLRATDYGDGWLQISSLIPLFWSLKDISTPGGFILSLLGWLSATIVVALFVVRFVSRKIFLLNLPLWSPGTDNFPTRGQSVFAICRSPQARDAYLGSRAPAVDLRALAAEGEPQQGLEQRLADFDKQFPGVPILIDHFEHGSSDKDLNEKLRLIEELVQVRSRTVSVLSAIGPASLQRGASAPRWVELLKAFVIIDLDPCFETDARSTTDNPGNMATQEPGRDRRTGWLSWVKDPSSYAERRQERQVWDTLDREKVESNSYLVRIYDDLSRKIERIGAAVLDREQLLDEFGERARNYYEALWTCCSPVEKLVLQHLAEDGFANYRDGRAVRGLISRGLIRRDPHFRLMNETFRRFVLSGRCRGEVNEVEQQTQASAWDRFWRPFVTVLAIVLVLFVATQKARFDALMAIITAGTAGIPGLLKLVGLIVGDRQSPQTKPS